MCQQGHSSGNIDVSLDAGLFKKWAEVDVGAGGGGDPWTNDAEVMNIGEHMNYVDLMKNPERFTGYSGQSATRIWSAIYDENCFVHDDVSHNIGNIGTDGSIGSGVSDAGARGTGGGGHDANVAHDDVDDARLIPTFESQQQCVEKRVFYRIVSGLHSSITTHLTHDFSHDFSTHVFEPNVDLFFERLGKHPTRVHNMYLTYLMLLRAVSRAIPTFYKFEYKTNQHSDRIQHLLHQLAQITHTCPNTFDENTMFQGGDAGALKKQFKNHFRNISVILDCVTCERCKLWGKLQINGLGTALKILFDAKQLKEGELFHLERTELVALIHTFRRLSESLKWSNEMFKEYAAKHGADINDRKFGGEKGASEDESHRQVPLESSESTLVNEEIQQREQQKQHTFENGQDEMYMTPPPDPLPQRTHTHRHGHHQDHEQHHDQHHRHEHHNNHETHDGNAHHVHTPSVPNPDVELNPEMMMETDFNPGNVIHMGPPKEEVEPFTELTDHTSSQDHQQHHQDGQSTYGNEGTETEQYLDLVGESGEATLSEEPQLVTSTTLPVVDEPSVSALGGSEYQQMEAELNSQASVDSMEKAAQDSNRFETPSHDHSHHGHSEHSHHDHSNPGHQYHQHVESHGHHHAHQEVEQVRQNQDQLHGHHSHHGHDHGHGMMDMNFGNDDFGMGTGHGGGGGHGGHAEPTRDLSSFTADPYLPSELEGFDLYMAYAKEYWTLTRVAVMDFYVSVMMPALKKNSDWYSSLALLSPVLLLFIMALRRKQHMPIPFEDPIRLARGAASSLSPSSMSSLSSSSLSSASPQKSSKRQAAFSTDVDVGTDAMVGQRSKTFSNSSSAPGTPGAPSVSKLRKPSAEKQRQQQLSPSNSPDQKFAPQPSFMNSADVMTSSPPSSSSSSSFLSSAPKRPTSAGAVASPATPSSLHHPSVNPQREPSSAPPSTTPASVSFSSSTAAPTSRPTAGGARRRMPEPGSAPKTSSLPLPPPSSSSNTTPPPTTTSTTSARPSTLSGGSSSDDTTSTSSMAPTNNNGPESSFMGTTATASAIDGSNAPPIPLPGVGKGPSGRNVSAPRPRRSIPVPEPSKN